MSAGAADPYFTPWADEIHAFVDAQPGLTPQEAAFMRLAMFRLGDRPGAGCRDRGEAER